MDIQAMDQGLLKRNPALTPEEFPHHWFTKHAPLVIPFFLHSGVKHYEQIHGPLKATSPSLEKTVAEYDGVAGMPPQEMLDHPPPMPKWKQAYYDEVIKVDERRFLVSEALEHIFRVGPGSVEGLRKVVIRDGIALVEVPEGVWEVWREYERRGREE